MSFTHSMFWIFERKTLIFGTNAAVCLVAIPALLTPPKGILDKRIIFLFIYIREYVNVDDIFFSHLIGREQTFA